MKLPNGAGSVYKRKDKNRSRPWVAVVSTGFSSGGKQKRTVIGYYAKREEADEAIVAWRRNPTSKLDITLEELYKEWKEPHTRDLSHSTARGYEIAWNHLAPIKDEKIRNIRTGQLQNVIDNAKSSDGKPLSYSSLHKIRLLISLLMDYAIKNDIVSTNYAEYVKLPKKKSSERSAFTELELKKIEKAAGTLANADTVLVLCYTGFRIDEFLSLTKFSYDPKKKTLTGGNKTDSGKDRTVPVHSKIQSIIENWFDTSSGDYLFSWPDGRKYSPDYYRKKMYYPVLEALEIEKKPPHCTRHTFASLLHSAKVDAVNIQKLMGHADYAVTANIYTHVDVDELRNAVESI